MKHKHTHEYESTYHPSPTAEAKALGITAAEIRKCKICKQEMTFVQLKNNWVPLFEDQEFEDQGVLLS